MYLPLGESSEDIRVGRAGARRPAFGPVVLALFGLVVAAGVFLPQGAWATFTYQETDTAGTNNAFSCDGTTLSSAGRANLQMIQGGTAGTTGNTVTLGAFENSIGYSLISPSNDPNLVSWQNGNWLVRLDVTTAEFSGHD